MEIGEGLKWVGATIISLISLFGVGKLFEIRAQRRYAIQDKNSEIHNTNQSRQIEFDQYAFQKVCDRLDKVEFELADVRKELNSQMVKNATLETENKYLKETNVRQEQEIIHLRDDKNIQAAEIVLLKSSLKLATEKIEKLECDLKLFIEQKQGEK